MTKTNDYMKQAAEQIIALMQKHGADWCKPWSGIGAPHNVVTKRLIVAEMLSGLRYAPPIMTTQAANGQHLSSGKRKARRLKRARSQPRFSFSAFLKEKIRQRVKRLFPVFGSTIMSSTRRKLTAMRPSLSMVRLSNPLKRRKPILLTLAHNCATAAIAPFITPQAITLPCRQCKPLTMRRATIPHCCTN